ncbi:MAG: VIT1/CCC1 transporter family protein [Anaerolineae bacterium]|nr:VIT1/CCC1 transporter family protein [Anaerolineae bacterium]
MSPAATKQVTISDDEEDVLNQTKTRTEANEDALSGRGGRELHRLGARLSEIILGGQDGLVNTMGVILGIAAATDETRIIIVGGLAAAFAESISMAAVAYTSTLANMDFYRAQLRREYHEVEHMPEMERAEITEIFKKWGFEGKLLQDVVEHISKNKHHWVEIMMAHELELQPIDAKGLLPTTLLVGFSAIVGSLIPLIPFFFMHHEPAIWTALVSSAAVLFGVGAIKANLTVGRPFRSGIQMMAIGILSALAGYGVGLLFGSQPGG